MPKQRKRHESFEQKLEAYIIKISPTAETLAAVATLVESIIAIAGVVKVPLEVEKVAQAPAGKVTRP